MLSVVVAPAGVASVVVLVRVARRARTVERATALRPSRSVPAWIARPLGAALRAAGLDLDVPAALAWWAVGAITTFALGSVVSPVLGLLGAAGAIAGAPIGLRWARGRGRRRSAAAVPVALERCALELRAGGTVASAIEAVADHDGPLAHDFARARERVALGAAVPDAVAQWATECDAPGVRAAAGALALAATVGGPCAGALDGLATSLRERLAVIAEARAQSAQARLSAIVVGVAPIGYLAWSAVVDPGPLRTLLGSFAGRLCVAVAIGLEALAVVWMRRILREEAAWS
jgi:tight adherence protein B